MPKFKKGQSGNPKGRPKRSASQRALLEAIEQEAPLIIEAVIESAKRGDLAAAKLQLDRVLPTLKPVDQSIAFEASGDIQAGGQQILSLMAQADITPSQGKSIFDMLLAQMRIAEFENLAKRIERLEGIHE